MVLLKQALIQLFFVMTAVTPSLSQCPAASFPKVITGKTATGVTTVQDISYYDATNIILAGGYSNEFGGTETTDMFPWVAQFKVIRTSTQPVIFWGTKLDSLPNYQVLSVDFYEGFGEERFYAFLKPLSCTPGQQNGYILSFHTANSANNKAWGYQFYSDCNDKKDYLNQQSRGQSNLYIAFASRLASNKFLITQFHSQDTTTTPIRWQQDSPIGHDVLGLYKYSSIFVFSRNSMGNIEVQKIGVNLGDHQWTQSLDIAYSEAPLIVEKLNTRMFVTTRRASGGFFIARLELDGTEAVKNAEQLELTQTSVFNNLKLRGMNVHSDSSITLLMLQYTSADYKIHMMKLDFVLQKATEYQTVLPVFKGGGNAHQFVPVAVFPSSSNQLFYMASTLDGGEIMLYWRIKKDNVEEKVIELQNTNVVTLIFTNQMKDSCQQEEPLDLSTAPMTDLRDFSKYTFTPITVSTPVQTAPLLPAFYTPLSPPLYPITLQSSVLAPSTPLDDLIATENIDSDCLQYPVTAKYPLQQTISIQRGQKNTYSLNLIFESISVSGCTLSDSKDMETKYKIVNAPSASIGEIKLKDDKKSYDQANSIEVKLNSLYTLWIETEMKKTKQIVYYQVDFTMPMPPIFTDFQINTVIGPYTILVNTTSIILPAVNYLPSTYADITVITPPASGLNEGFANTKVDSSQPRFQLNVAPTKTPYYFGKYQMEVELFNDEGTTSPYLIDIVLQDTPPQFVDLSSGTQIGQFSVQVGQIYYYMLPTNILNLEEQNLSIEILDLRTYAQVEFITIEDGNILYFTASPTTLRQKGTYNLMLKLLDDRGTYSPYYLIMKVVDPPNLAPPKFNMPLPNRGFRIALGEELNYVLPLIRDPDIMDINPKIILKVIGILTNYVQIHSEAHDVNILKCMVPESENATFPLNVKLLIEIILDDQNPQGSLQSSYRIFIEFYERRPIQNFSNILNQTKPEKVIPNKTFPIPARKSSKPLKVKIIQINTQGIVTLRYSDKFTNTSIINSTILDIKVRKSFNSEGNKTILSWNVTRITSREVDIWLQFAAPEDISQELFKDVLDIEVIQNDTIYRTNDFDTFEMNHTVSFVIPKQIKLTNALQMMLSAANAAQTSMLTIIITNVVLQVFLSFSMQLVWGLLNTLQLISYTIQFALNVPDNVFLFFFVINDLLSMRAKFIQDLLDDMMDQIITVETNSEGESENVIQNMGTMFVILVAIVMIAMIVLVLGLLLRHSKKFRKIFDAVKKKIFFNSILRYTLQSYLKTLVIAMTILSKQNYDSSNSSAINSSIGVFITFFASVYPIWVYFFMKRNQQLLQAPEYSERFSALYLSLNTEIKSALYHTSFFLARRFLLSVSLVFLPSAHYFQVLSTHLVSLILLFFLTTQFPMQERIFNYLEIFNEGTFFMTTSLLLAFTDYTPYELPSKGQRKETREMYGWVFIGIVSFYILVNLLYIIKGIIKGVILKIKAKCSKKPQKTKVKNNPSMIFLAQNNNKSTFGLKNQVEILDQNSMFYREETPRENQGNEQKQQEQQKKFDDVLNSYINQMKQKIVPNRQYENFVNTMQKRAQDPSIPGINPQIYRSMQNSKKYNQNQINTPEDIFEESDFENDQGRHISPVTRFESVEQTTKARVDPKANGFSQFVVQSVTYKNSSQKYRIK